MAENTPIKYIYQTPEKALTYFQPSVVLQHSQ